MASKVVSRVLFSKHQRELKVLCSGVRFYSQENYETIITSKAGAEKNVGIIQLNRPKAWNSINNKLVDEITSALKAFDNDKSVGAIILTGNEKVFAAGADLKEMFGKTFAKLIQSSEGGDGEHKVYSRKPLIGAVNGMALGGGNELAMLCDIIYAGENALFGQPEIIYGITPGAGGTQRLTRAVGKSKAMEIVLTGMHVPAKDAERMGLISKVFPVEKTLEESIKLAEKIASNSQIINAIAKECVHVAFETTLTEGLRFEKRMWHSCFATKDQKEGMAAFVEKRKAKFTHE